MQLAFVRVRGSNLKPSTERISRTQILNAPIPVSAR
jgi:hypothetical protein